MNLENQDRPSGVAPRRRISRLLAVAVACLGLTAGSLQATVAFAADDPTPLSVWRLNDASGTVAKDTGRAANDGTYVGGVTLGAPGWSPTSTSTAAAFDGVDDYVSVKRQIADDFSISLWFVSGQGIGSGSWYGGAGLFDGEVSGAQNDFGTSLLGDGRIAVGVGNPDQTAYSAAGYNNGQWHQVVMTRTKSTGLVTLYVDGARASSVTGNTNSLTAPANLRIGAIQTGFGGFFAGSLADVTIYDTALTAAQVTSGYSAPVALTRSATVDLGAKLTRPMDHVGMGFLNGLNEDGTGPVDDLLLPLHPNVIRYGGRISGQDNAWVSDGYKAGASYEAGLKSIIAQAKRVTTAPYSAEFVVVLSDLWGRAPKEKDPCAKNVDGVFDCTAWLAYLTTTINRIQDAGLKVTYEPFNEPELFWSSGLMTPQYFAMWDASVAKIRELAPGRPIEGPATAVNEKGVFDSFLTHTKAAGTLPDVLSIHQLGVKNNLIAEADMLTQLLADKNITGVTLSNNEYLNMPLYGEEQRNPGGTVNALSDLVLSKFDTAARAVYDETYPNEARCCSAGNLGGILTSVASGPGGKLGDGQYWAYRSYADLSGAYVSTKTSILPLAAVASSDPATKRAVIVIGDQSLGGPVQFTLKGLASQPWMAGAPEAKVEIRRIPNTTAITGLSVVSSQIVRATDSIPITLSLGAAEALAIYVTPVNSGLVSSWSLRDTTGTTAVDTGPAGNNGTYNGGVSLSSGGATFDGVNDYVTVKRQIADDFSIAFSFKSTKGSGNGANWFNGSGLVDGETSGAVNDFGVSLLADGRVAAGIGNPDTSVFSKAGFNDGVWHQVVFTRVKSTGIATLYLDGVQVGSLTGNSNSLTAPTNIRFGSLATGVQFFAGSIDDVAVYSQAMSASEVAARYQQRAN